MMAVSGPRAETGAASRVHGEASLVVPWGREVVRRTGGQIPFLQYEPRLHRLPQLLTQSFRWAHRDHLVQGDRRISYGRFLSAVDVVAAALRERGVSPGDRVMLLAANSPEWVVAYWAVLRAGAVVAPGNGWWSEDEVGHAIQLVEPALAVGDDRRLAKVSNARETMTMDNVRSMVDRGPPTAAEWRPPAIDNTDEDEDDPAVIVFTSGTTGLPKGATLSHRAVIANLHNLLVASGRLPQDLPTDGGGAVNLVTGPLFHIGGLQVLSLGMATGGTMVFLEGRFEPRHVLDIIEKERVDVWGAVPTMALRVLDDPSLPLRRLESVRSVSLGGAPVPPDLIGRLRAAFPNADRGISTIYGLTETGGTVAAASGAVMAQHPGTSGRPLPVVELRIAEPNADGIGEILVRTPGQMSGYWKEPENPIVDEDGFVHTGDLGRLVDGFLFVTGRSKDIIIRGGENIAAPHVEAVLTKFPTVVDAAVIGLPDSDLGEKIAAVVVIRPDRPVDLEALATFARAHLAHFEIPTSWWISQDPLPTNAAGKVDKRRIAAMWPSDLT